MVILSKPALKNRPQKRPKIQWMDVKRIKERELNLKLLKLKTSTESVPKPSKKASKGRTVGVIEQLNTF